MRVEILCQNQLLPKTTPVKKHSQAQIAGMVKIKQVSLLQHPSDTVSGQVCNYQEQKHIFFISLQILGICSGRSCQISRGNASAWLMVKGCATNNTNLYIKGWITKLTKTFIKVWEQKRNDAQLLPNSRPDVQLR